jgi:hypothetical protein
MRNRTADDGRVRAIAAARGRDERLMAAALVAGAVLTAGCLYGMAALS